MTVKTIYSKYDKKQIPTLPQALFPGRIIVVLTEEEAKKAVDYLLTQPLLGFDTETKPVFQRGQHNKVALLQVSTEDTCFLFRLNRIGLAPCIVRLLEDEGREKIALSWHDDVLSLRERGKFQARGFQDLQDLMPRIGVRDMSLAKLYANLFGCRISKREQLSNWEADVLSERQKGYAATDAWACVRLYGEYRRLLREHSYNLVEVPEE